MSATVLAVHPEDDMIVALVDHSCGQQVKLDNVALTLCSDVPAKHKFARQAFSAGDGLRMYGITVGRAMVDIRQGELISTANLEHATDEVEEISPNRDNLAAAWRGPNVSRWTAATFGGFHRPDGRVGVRNYWIFVPLVFCQNRNLEVLRQALSEELGYGSTSEYHRYTKQLVDRIRNGESSQAIRDAELSVSASHDNQERVFPNIDGVKFLRHELGCGGTYQDATNLCGLIAGYINHPNVAGATILSLGCQKSQIRTLEQQIQLRNSQLAKPLLIFEQQQLGSERTLIQAAICETMVALSEANQIERRPASLAKLSVGSGMRWFGRFFWPQCQPRHRPCERLVGRVGRRRDLVRVSRTGGLRTRFGGSLRIGAGG